jgi:hemerythrin-like domain-containing protein
MIEIIEILRQEHRNIEKLLGVLEREFSVFDRGDRPDYEVVLAVVDYFKGYPDSCHHPKEDIIVEKFKARDPLAASTIVDLQAEHREGARRLQRVAQAVEDVLSDQGLLRQTVNDIVRDFVNHERRHMATEERVVFPAVIKALRSEDWADIALQLADRYGSPSESNFEEKFGALWRDIVKLEDAALDARPNRELGRDEQGCTSANHGGYYEQHHPGAWHRRTNLGCDRQLGQEIPRRCRPAGRVGELLAGRGREHGARCRGER